MSDSASLNTRNTNQTPVTKKVLECLSRIQNENNKWHAISNQLTEHAVSRAIELDHSIAEGKEPEKLHGLPFVVKELIDLKGLITPFGSNSYTSEKSSENAPVIDRLEKAGAVLMGTAHMVEFAIGSWGTNSVKGTPWNPADSEIHRVPGGSSSGSVVAVASGMVPAAIGSDTGGSIRIPASLCGVIGYKPTFGWIPTDGVAPLGPTFDTLGPISKTVDDARRLTEVMSERDLSHAPVDLSELRVAVVSRDTLAPIFDEIENAYEGALTRLKRLGATISEIDLPLSFPEFQRLNGGIVSYEIYQHISPIVEDMSNPIDNNIRNRVLAGRDISSKQYTEALEELDNVRKSFNSTFSEFDVLILPGTPICASPLTEVDESQIPMSRYTRIANCLDMCAISMPLARSTDELPIGWQLCATAGSDAYLLALAEQVESDEYLGKELRRITHVS